jgi:ubiquinone/menaquinone biosynthesis C-methylase UbiE
MHENGQDRVTRERAFHDKRYGRDDMRASAGKYYSIMENARSQYKRLIAGYCKGKKLLEYGCGVGDESLEWLKRGAIVTGIDISGEAISRTKNIISENGYIANYYVMNAEKTEFADGSFDLIVGTGILHHLDLTNSFAELSRILKPDGHGIFIEPLGHNPIINFYRWLTPSMRTEDEHPLMDKDIQLLSEYFYEVQTYYYNLCTIVAVPIRNKSYFQYTYRMLQSMDKILFTLPYLKKFAWIVVLHVSRPKRDKIIRSLNHDGTHIGSVA